MNGKYIILLVLLGIATLVKAQNIPNLPQPYIPGKPHQTSAKTTATISRLIAFSDSSFDGANFVFVDSGRHQYSGSHGYPLPFIYKGYNYDWDYDSNTFFIYQNGQPTPITTTKFVYNANGQPIQILDYFDNQVEKKNISYDVSDNMIEYEKEEDTGRGFYKKSRILKSYNNINQLISTVNQRWNDTRTAYISDDSTVITYDAGLILSETTYGYGRPEFRNTYTYDNRNLKQVLNECYDPIPGEWDACGKIEYYYDAAGNLSNVKGFDGHMKQSYERTFSYDADNNILTDNVSLVHNATIVPMEKNTMSYNSYNQVIKMCNERWDRTRKIYEHKSTSMFYYEEFTTGIKETAPKADNMMVYPNPAGNSFQLDISLQEPQTIFVTLYDITGKPVTKWNDHAGMRYFKSINTANLPSGNYIIVVEGNSERIHKKISITH